MAKQRGSPLSSPRDVDLLFLIREEAIYAERIKDALVFTESRMQRLVVPLVAREQMMRELKREQFVRPVSLADKEEEIDDMIQEKPRKPCKSKSRIVPRDVSVSSDGSFKSSIPYVNPAIDTRRTVDDNDAIFSEAASKERVEFTYADLADTREGRKITTVRALRRLANLWGINPKLNKPEMLEQLLAQYARRYPDEVEAYEKRRTTTRTGRIRRRARRR